MRCLSGLKTAVVIVTVTLLATTGWAAAHEKVLHSLREGIDPQTGLIADNAGNFYGTTEGGGIHAAGTVFALSPNADGGYTEFTLHSFGWETDGEFLYGSLIFDAQGNLYGTTQEGGIHNSGTVFELSPNGAGGWTERVLHSFGNGTDGAFPIAYLTLDAAGNLYGTTQSGGIHECFRGVVTCGTVFELSPNGSGGWTERVLHSFGNGTDGYYPLGGLTLDAAGNLYGTTQEGGIHDDGTVFELSPNGSGGWTESVLHSFGNGSDGQLPAAGLVFDTAGNLYTTTEGGGVFGYGAVVELSPEQGGGWSEKVFHNFDGSHGAFPLADLMIDAAGNLYSTTNEGGTYNYGVAFELTHSGGGASETVLHNFNNDGVDGYYPYSNMIMDGDGKSYGTASAGGIWGVGVVFKITPE